jgi:hypothetical protein
LTIAASGRLSSVGRRASDRCTGASKYTATSAASRARALAVSDIGQQPRLVAAHDQYVRTGRTQRFRDRQTDAGSAAGDDGEFTLEIHRWPIGRIETRR